MKEKLVIRVLLVVIPRDANGLTKRRQRFTDIEVFSVLRYSEVLLLLADLLLTRSNKNEIAIVTVCVGRRSR